MRLPRHQWSESCFSTEDPDVSLERNLLLSFDWTIKRKSNLRKFYWSMIGKKFLFGKKKKPYSYFVRKNYSYLCFWMVSIWLERKYQTDLEGLHNEVDLRESLFFSDHVYLIYTQSNYDIRNYICDNYRIMLESRIFAGATEKTIKHQNSEYFYVVLWHERSCQEVREAILRIDEQNYWITL